jgi:hypothetical protein
MRIESDLIAKLEFAFGVGIIDELGGVVRKSA